MPRLKEFDEKEALGNAMQLFWKQGYSATSMQDLVDALGINRASLYDTFGGKRELFQRALQEYREIYFAKMKNILEGPGSAREAMATLFEGAWRAASSDPDHKGCFVVNTTAELAARDQEIQQAVRENRENTQRLFATAIRKAQKAGEISRKKRPSELAGLLFAFYNGFQVLARMNPDEKEMHQLVRSALSLLD